MKTYKTQKELDAYFIMNCFCMDSEFLKKESKKKMPKNKM
jgi:hypothetical protein